jgi:fructose-1,6-bisphosphatase
MIPERQWAPTRSTSRTKAKWDEKTKELVASLSPAVEAPVGKRGARYSGALVTDFHRTLAEGRHLHVSRPERIAHEGKLRYLYESRPPGPRRGARRRHEHRRPDPLASSLQPSELHERCPLFIGSKGKTSNTRCRACLEHRSSPLLRGSSRHHAQVAESADAADLKSASRFGSPGSSPGLRTK